jgi:filamentous hemagglutinin family protein
MLKCLLVKSLGIGSFLSGFATIQLGIATAQTLPSTIISDDTLGAERSIVQPLDGLPIEIIDGGAQRGQNLFHSFRELNVGEGRSAYFFSGDPSIQNILARVTGKNPSQILGRLGTVSIINGEVQRAIANLFLINPNGILFGPNSSLAIDGSFVGTTANTIQFGDQGFFSASEPTAPALLTVNPSALVVNQVRPPAIQSQGELRVPAGKNLLLFGGNLQLEQSFLQAQGGRIELGGLASAGTVEMDWQTLAPTLNFLTSSTRSDVTVKDSLIDVSTIGRGDVSIYAHNLTFSSESEVIAGIRGVGDLIKSNAGDIRLDVTDTLRVESGSTINNAVYRNAIGNSGNIQIKTGSLFVSDGSSLNASVSGQGKAGAVVIEARDRVSFSQRSAIYNQIGRVGTGQSDGIEITSRSLELLDGSQFSTGVFGQGETGNIKLSISGALVIQGGKFGTSSDLVSGIFSTIEQNGRGQGGNIDISAETVSVSGIAQINSGLVGQGIAGNINIKAQTVQLNSEAASPLAPANIFTGVASSGFGRGGKIDLDVGNLELLNSAAIQSGVSGIGLGGDIKIKAQAITLSGRAEFEGALGDLFTGSAIATGLSVAGAFLGEDGTRTRFGVGRAGNIEINTQSLNLQDQASISTRSDGDGDAGEITIRADRINLIASGNTISSSTSYLGDAKNIVIQTRSLRLEDGSQISAFSEGEGQAGNIFVKATESVELSGFNPKQGTPSALFTDNEAISVGASGNITIETDRLRIGTGAAVDALTRNDQPGGDITIQARQVELLNGGQVNTTSRGAGSAGKITVTATEQLRIDGRDATFNERAEQFGVNRIGLVNASSGLYVRAQGTGKAGDIQVNAAGIALDNGGKLNAESFSGDGGSIDVQSGGIISLRRGSQISTTAGINQARGNGGNITLTALFLISAPLENNDITANASTDNGGRVTINTQANYWFSPRSRAELVELLNTDNPLQLDPSSLRTNEITAISQSNPLLNGQVAISASGFDPSRELGVLPTTVVDRSNQMAQNCSPQTQATNSFINTGRGGLPISPGSSLSKDIVTPTWVLSTNSTSHAAFQISQNKVPNSPIIEAQTWKRERNGDILLMAASSTSIPTHSQYSCLQK